MSTILVLEDDDVIRKVVVRILEEIGKYTVIDFPDPAPALKTVDFGDIDLILTDFTMPTNGANFIRNLKSQGIQIPIIVMSGDLSKSEEYHLKSLGVQAFIKKPFHLSDLLDLVQSCI